MESRIKEKVNSECDGIKHESNRLAFSLMSLGSESSRAFIPWAFAEMLAETWRRFCPSCCLRWNEKAETQEPNFKSSGRKRSLSLGIFLESRQLKDTTVTTLFALSYRNALQDFTSTTSLAMGIFLFPLIHTCSLDSQRLNPKLINIIKISF